MLRYDDKAAGDNDKDFYRIAEEVRKITPYLKWESSGKRWIKGLIFEIHAPNASLEKYLAEFYN